MTVALVRLDDRLVHGQVVIGWVQPLGVNRIALVDDRLRDDTWEQDICRLGVPPGIRVEFASVHEAWDRYQEWSGSSEQVLVLVGDVDHAVRLCEGAPVGRLNLGGIHHAPGRTERLAYMFLSDEEARQLQALGDTGVEISAQAVPSSKGVSFGELL